MEGIASRYALALSKIAREENRETQYLDLFTTVLTLLESDDTLANFLNNEFYSPQDKEKLIDTIFPMQTWFSVANFLKVLLRKHRTLFLKKIIQETVLLLKDILKSQTGIVYSVMPLSTDQLTRLAEAMSQYLKQPVQLTNQIDERLLGGIRLDINGKIFDASMINQLISLRAQLLKRG